MSHDPAEARGLDLRGIEHALIPAGINDGGPHTAHTPISVKMEPLANSAKPPPALIRIEVIGSLTLVHWPPPFRVPTHDRSLSSNTKE